MCLARRYTLLEGVGARRARSLCQACLPCSSLCLLTAVPSHLALYAPSAMQLQPRSAFCSPNASTSAVCWRRCSAQQNAAKVKGKGAVLSKGRDITEEWQQERAGCDANAKKGKVGGERKAAWSALRWS